MVLRSYKPEHGHLCLRAATGLFVQKGAVSRSGTQALGPILQGSKYLSVLYKNMKELTLGSLDNELNWREDGEGKIIQRYLEM